MPELISRPVTRLAGEAAIPGDKSISHRALIFGGLSVGETLVSGLLEGDDVLATAAAMRAFGARVERTGEGRWRVQGVGVGGLAEPANVLDLGNSGTGARLLIGLAAGSPVTSFFTGDASLRRRPMNRVIQPLTAMGAEFHAREGGRLPLCVIGARPAAAIDYTLPVASAQVKSAILLAGLNAAGLTTVIEPKPTRDHTENLLRHFGAEVTVTPRPDGGREVALVGEPELKPADIVVPADVSSAAFLMVAAALIDGPGVRLPGIGLNPLRTGLIDCLIEMGADLKIENRRQEQFEPVGDIVVRGGRLKGITVPEARAPTMIDEYPVLAVAAAFAQGRTVMRGAEELRVKESDRIAAMAAGLARLGVRVEALPDGLIVDGTGGPAPAAGDAVIETFHDHRIAMSFLVYGMAARAAVAIDDDAMIRTSFPDFVALANGLGADIGPAGRGTAR
jgi:3-phosphoshikimate 1-carboxyvinyltransferase